MGGFGIRFKEKGFAVPKPLINVDGKPMFMKSIESLSSLKCNKKYTFIVRYDHNNEFHIVDRIREFVPDADFIILMENTCGAVETCLKARGKIDQHDAMIILDCDLEFYSQSYFQEIEEDLEKDWNEVDIVGRIVSFPSHENRYSYAKTDENDFVTETAEKIVISSNAITGSYYFAYADLFFKNAKKLVKDFKSGKLNFKEAYLSLIYNKIIEDGKKVKLHHLEKYNSFGTPDELARYYEMQKVTIKGHSGCLTEKISLENGDPAFRKSTKDAKYVNRLEKQFSKQIAFKEASSQSDYFQAPAIYSMTKNANECSALMEFIDGKSFVDVFENDDSGVIRRKFIENILNFIDYEISQSKMTSVSRSVFIDKFKSVKQNVMNNSILNSDNEIIDIINKYDSVFDLKEDFEMPVGMSHGDFTLSNVIFEDSHCWLVDFLDSFIETPYMDIVKLRQDTKYNWSYLLLNKNDIFYKSKQNLILIDKAIVDHFKNDEIFLNSYPILQKLNFLRILQYAKDPRIISYLKIILKDLLETELMF